MKRTSSLRLGSSHESESSIDSIEMSDFMSDKNNRNAPDQENQ